MKEKAEAIEILEEPIKFRSLFTLRSLSITLSLSLYFVSLSITLSLTVSSLNDRFLCLYSTFYFLLQYLHVFRLVLVSFFFFFFGCTFCDFVLVRFRRMIWVFVVFVVNVIDRWLFCESDSKNRELSCVWFPRKLGFKQ